MEKGKLLQNENINKAIQVSKITLIINLGLSLLKFTAGYIGKSSAMLSDAVHSASDVLSTIVVMVGIKISEKQSDKEHPYGHERMECVASIILSVALAITGAGIGYSCLLYTSYICKGVHASLNLTNYTPYVILFL